MNTSGSSSGQRKKREKPKKISKQKKHKSCTTLAYQRNESDVQQLLEKHSSSSSSNVDATSAAAGTRKTIDWDAESISFFCGTTSVTLSSTLHSQDSARTYDVDQNQRNSMEEDDDEEVEEIHEHIKYTMRWFYFGDDDDDDDEENDVNQDDDVYDDDDAESVVEEAAYINENTTTTTTTESSNKVQLQQQRKISTTTGTNATDATFILIELDEPLVLPGLQCWKHNYDDDALLFYKPTTQIVPQIKLEAGIDDEMLHQIKPATSRMLNRYYEEAQASGAKLNKTIIKALLQMNEINMCNFLKDNKRYNTVCNFKFKPIFVTPTAVQQQFQLSTRKLVKIYFKHLRFTQHQHILEEHHLTHELEDIFEEYNTQIAQRKDRQLWSQLQNARKIVQSLATTKYNDISPNRTCKFTEEMNAALTLVKQLRTEYFDVAATQKLLLKKLLDKWAALKLIRKNQQYQCTRFQLRLQVEQPQDIAGAYAEWQLHFEEDLSELYREALELYYTEKRAWNKWHNSMTRRRSNANDVDDDDYNDYNNIKPPRKPNIELIRKTLETQYAECFYEPEEPQVQVMRMNTDDSNTQRYHNLPSQQQHKLRSYYLKIYFDQQFVGQTRVYRLEPDLNLYMNEMLGILLERHLPTDIQIMLFEKSLLKAHSRIAIIQIPSIMDANNHKFRFNGAQCAGDIYLQINFDDDEQEQSQSIFYDDTTKVITSNIELSEPSSPLPESEKQTELNSSTTATMSSSNFSKYDDEIFEENLLQFCSMESIMQNKRFRLLRSRYERNNLRTKDLRFIPSLDNEIAFDWEEESEPVIDMGNWMDAIDLYKHNGKKSLRNLYERLTNHCQRMEKISEQSQELLFINEPDSWSTIFRAIASIFSPRRPLQAADNTAKMLPTANGAQQTLTSLDNTQNFNIVLNVLRATGIPVRSRHYLSFDDGANIAQTLIYSNVRPFIVLSYQDRLSRTNTAEGSNPTWNEQLVISVKSCIDELRDDLKIILYDEYIEQYNASAPDEDVSTRSNADIYQRVQTNWLGEYRIPLNSLITHGKYEGCFELTTPKVLVGYKRPTIDSVTNIPIENYPEIKESVHIWCYLSIEPKLELPHLNTRCLECTELHEVRGNLQQWCLDLQSTLRIEPLICNADGQRVCITRLLEPVPLPDECGTFTADEIGLQLDLACRFVSLLSVLKQYEACMGFNGIWLDNKTLLDNSYGSAKDFGVLLCNYLLTLGLRCWLVLGVAAPYGECTFVLYRREAETSGSELLLIAPHTGKRYCIKDVQCPLSRIYCIVAQDNIYCNLQTETRVSMTNFNLNDTNCWLPAFNKRNPAPLGGMQQLDYTYKTTENFIQLRKNIERKIMKKISAWRPMRKTIWNRAFQSHLLEILQELENIATHGITGDYEEPKYSEYLEQTFPGYKIYGFTLNFPYTNLTSISERIRSTGIHLNNDRFVEFSVAVHIHAYSNNVLSIWIFLISLIPF